jgi:hypothetical protein
VTEALRRAGGGGLLSVASANEGGAIAGSEAEGLLLDATQLRVADVLTQRLDKELEIYRGAVNENARYVGTIDDLATTGGVLLFKGASFRLEKVDEFGTKKIGSLKENLRRSEAISEPSSSDDSGELQLYASVAVDSEAVVTSAKQAAMDAASNVVPLEIDSDAEGGRARQRRRKKDRETAKIRSEIQYGGACEDKSTGPLSEQNHRELVKHKQLFGKSRKRKKEVT